MPKSPDEHDTRAKILRVAETQFGAKGYAGTHLQSIAAEVGVQKTALYYYFESKDALYATVLERMLESFEEVFGRATAGGDLSADTLQSAIRDFDRVLSQNPNFSPIIMRIFIDRIEVGATAIEPLVTRIITPLLEFYAAGVSAGLFRKMSARHALLSLIGAATFYYAAGSGSAEIVGVADIFGEDAAEWRHRELSTFVMGGLLPDPAEVDANSRESD